MFLETLGCLLFICDQGISEQDKRYLFFTVAVFNSLQMLECFVWLSVEQRRKKPFLLHIKGWCMKGWCTTLVVSWQDFSTHLLLPSVQPAVFHCALSPNCPVPPVTLNHVVLPIPEEGEVWGSPLTSPWKDSLQSTWSRLLHFNRI